MYYAEITTIDSKQYLHRFSKVKPETEIYAYNDAINCFCNIRSEKVPGFVGYILSLDTALKQNWKINV